MTCGHTPDRERIERDREAASAPAAANPDAEDVRAVRQGDANAFARLVERHQRRLFGLALMLTREGPAAEEVAQDAFVRAFTELDAFDEQRPFYPWLATIAVRLAQNWLARRARVDAREGGSPTPGSEPAAADDPLAALIADERSRDLWRSVAALPSGERAAALLFYRQELSVREIARALGVTSGTVKTLLFRARQRLRRTASPAPREEEER